VHGFALGNIAGPDELAVASHDTWLLAALKQDRKEISHGIRDIERVGADVDAGLGSGG
jgi:hypothetical protein